MDASTAQPPLPSSKHFRLERLAEGVYAAIAAEAGGSVCNAGILDLGDQCLIFDTFQTPQAALDLRAAAEQVTGRSVTYVINSHWHGDHVHGNVAFAPETPIVATEKTRELMATRSVEEIEEDRRNLGRYLDSLEQQIAQETHEARRASLSAWLASNREYAAVLPTLEIRLPTLTFVERMVFHGSRRSAELLCYGGGHTQSDALLYLPGERIAFLGDLLFARCHPWLPGGNPEEWSAILQRVERMQIDIAVPGHGPVGTLADAALLRQYIADLQALAQQAIRDGTSSEDLRQIAVPERYATWHYRSFFRKNLRFLHKRLIDAGEYMRA